MIFDAFVSYDPNRGHSHPNRAPDRVSAGPCGPADDEKLD